jgi:hypothetical protein
VLKAKLASPVCLLSKLDEAAWLWHARYGHLNFRSLHDLRYKDMVEGLPRIHRVEHVCDGCALRKQHQAPFPRATAYKTQKGLELVHVDRFLHLH